MSGQPDPDSTARPADEQPASEAKLITHARVAKQLDLPTDFLGFAADQGLLSETVEHRGQWWMFHPDRLPGRDQTIAAVRARYRDLLLSVDGAANAVLAEIEAVQDDARDMAENYIDPVGEFGDDLEMVLQFRHNTTLSRHMYRLRDIGWEVRRAHGCLYQLDRPDITGYAPDVDPPLPVRPRRSQR